MSNLLILFNHKYRKMLRQLQFTLLFILAILTIFACAKPNSQNQNIITPVHTKTRMVDHAKGEVQIPNSPERIVVLDDDALDIVLALGVKPVGAMVRVSRDFPAYLDEQTRGIEIIGYEGQPNFEKILLLKPDLILSNINQHNQIYDRLSQISPTVLSETRGASGEWKESLMYYANVLGKTDKSEKLLSEYNSKVEKLKKELGNTTASTKVSVIGSLGGRIGYFTKASFAGSVLEDVGFARPTDQNATDNFVKPVSRENIDSLDGSVIFILNFSRDKSTLEKFKSDPLFSQLKAVKKGKIYQVDAQIWSIGSGIQAANQLLDDLSKYLVK